MLLNAFYVASIFASLGRRQFVEVLLAKVFRFVGSFAEAHALNGICIAGVASEAMVHHLDG